MESYVLCELHKGRRSGTNVFDFDGQTYTVNILGKTVKELEIGLKLGLKIAKVDMTNKTNPEFICWVETSATKSAHIV